MAKLESSVSQTKAPTSPSIAPSAPMVMQPARPASPESTLPNYSSTLDKMLVAAAQAENADSSATVPPITPSAPCGYTTGNTRSSASTSPTFSSIVDKLAARAENSDSDSSCSSSSSGFHTPEGSASPGSVSPARTPSPEAKESTPPASPDTIRWNNLIFKTRQERLAIVKDACDSYLQQTSNLSAEQAKNYVHNQFKQNNLLVADANDYLNNSSLNNKQAEPHVTVPPIARPSSPNSGSDFDMPSLSPGKGDSVNSASSEPKEPARSTSPVRTVSPEPSASQSPATREVSVSNSTASPVASSLSPVDKVSTEQPSAATSTSNLSSTSNEAAPSSLSPSQPPAARDLADSNRTLIETASSAQLSLEIRLAKADEAALNWIQNNKC